MDFPQRKYPRADFHDYNGGMYYVTVCTRNKYHYFGHINDGLMYLSTLGMELRDNIQYVDSRSEGVYIPQFTVMPNHFHAIIIIDTPNLSSASCDSEQDIADHFNSRLGIVVGGIKAHLTRFARSHGIEFGWQPRYYDRVIRNIRECNLINEYIENNVARWAARL